MGRDGRTALGSEQSKESSYSVAIEGDISEETMAPARRDPVPADPAAIAETHGFITETVKDCMDEFGGWDRTGHGEERRGNPLRHLPWAAWGT